MSWFLNNEILFIIPIILFIIFIFISNTNWYKKIDELNIRRAYYLFCLIWSFRFIYIFYGDITRLTLSNQIVNNSSGTNTNDFNVIWCIVILFGIFIIWDFLFISCKSITGFSIKGLSITTEDIKELNGLAIAKSEDSETMGKILKCEYIMINNAIYDFSDIEEIDPEKLYKDLFKKYVKLRGNITLDCYLHNTDGYKEIKNKYKLDEVTFSSMQNALEFNGVVCTPESDMDAGKEMMYAVITTKYIEYNLIVVITSKKIIANEYLALQNIVSSFEKTIDIAIRQMKIDELLV